MPEPLGPMIAWVSPLRIVRSIPWRISRSGCAAGATRRSRITSSRSSAMVTKWLLRGWVRDGVDGLAGRGGAGRVRSGSTVRWLDRDEVGEGHAVERARDRVADADPQHVDRAAGGAVAGLVLLGVRGADHRRDRALEGAQDVAHPDLVRGRAELVAAAGAARGRDEAGVPEAGDELLQVGARQVLVQRDLGEAGRPGAVAAPELDHEPDAVLALRGEGDGAGTMEARAVRQGSILVGRSDPRSCGTGAAGIPTDFVGISLAARPSQGATSERDGVDDEGASRNVAGRPRSRSRRDRRTPMRRPSVASERLSPGWRCLCDGGVAGSLRAGARPRRLRWRSSSGSRFGAIRAGPAGRRCSVACLHRFTETAARLVVQSSDRRPQLTSLGIHRRPTRALTPG